MTMSVPADKDALATIRLRLLSFSTSDMLHQALTPAFAAAECDAQVTLAGFGTVVPELLEPRADKPDTLIIQMDMRGFYSRDWRRTPVNAESLFEEKIDVFLTAIERFADTGGCPVLINSLPSPASPTAGFLDTFHRDGAGFSTSYFNRRLSETAQRCNRITVIDTDLAMAHIAPARRSDAKLWFYGRIPYSTEATRALAQGFAEAYAAQKAKPVKVLALDLDDTLWRGIYGEDGLAGLDCGDDFPGNAYKALQEECLRLKGQGMLLTILSKNDADVLRVFDEHPGMALERDDFVAHRINWAPKAHNIRALAEDLDLGLDSFVFLDDSPHEREAMRRLAPEVRVPELPEDPAVRPDFLRNYTPAWPLRLTAEDRSRSELYAVQTKGRALKRQAVSYEDYLAKLGQRLHVEAMNPATLPRVAQMHARTNQFNLTTRRLTEVELAAMMTNDDDHSVVLGRLDDRFGNHGIVICASARLTDASAELVTFLMSCRVIGREIEQAFLGALLQHLTARGIERVEGTYIPTDKNTPARNFYENMGFAPQRTVEPEDGAQTKWLWHKDTHTRPGSDFVTIELAI